MTLQQILTIAGMFAGWAILLLIVNYYAIPKPQPKPKPKPKISFLTKHKNANTPRLCYKHLEGRSSKIAVVVNPRYCEACKKKI